MTNHTGRIFREWGGQWRNDLLMITYELGVGGTVYHRGRLIERAFILDDGIHVMIENEEEII
ncbi:hypothetical protein GCM10027299_28750 [Larkinella ripae]